MYIYIYVAAINKKETMNLKNSKERYMGKTGARKGKGVMM